MPMNYCTVEKHSTQLILNVQYRNVLYCNIEKHSTYAVKRESTAPQSFCTAILKSTELS